MALLLAVGNDNGTTSTAAPRHMSSSGMANMGGMTTSGTQTTQAALASQKLTILHVQRGCHVWSDGTAQTPMLQLNMKPGRMLEILNQDVDMHRVVELSGPMMMLGGPMKTGASESLTFAKPGTYRFGTKSSEMEGMPAAATIGPDNTLRLTVVVA